MSFARKIRSIFPGRFSSHNPFKPHTARKASSSAFQMIETLEQRILLHSGGWFDAAGLDQFYASDTTAVGTSAGNASKAVNGQVNSGGNATMKDAGSYWQAKIAWPDTSGTVNQQLHYVKIATANTTGFAIDVTDADTTAGATWTRVYSGTTTGDSQYHQYNFTPTNANFVRIVKVGSGWLNLKEVDFFGDAVYDSAASQFGVAAYNTIEGLDELRDRTNNGTHPAGVTLSELQSMWPDQNYTPQAPTTLITQDAGRNDLLFKQDTEAAYGNALMWHITQDTTYAQNVVNIAEDWINTTTSITGGNDSLFWGTMGTPLIMAIDIVKETYSGYPASLDADFKDWVNDVWGQTIMKVDPATVSRNTATLPNRTNMLYAIQTDSRYQFNRTTDLWVTNISRATQTAAWGENAEVGRDHPHSQMNVGGMSSAAEVAWNQGVDLYGLQLSGDDAYLDYRLATVVDYVNQISNVGQATTPYPTNINNDPNWDGVIRNQNGSPVVGSIGKVGTFGYEMAYNHYKNRLGVEMPELKKRIDYTRANNLRDGFNHGMGWGTITHADLGGSTGGESTIADDNFNSGDISGGSGWDQNWILAGNADIATSGGPQGSHHLRLRGGNPDGSAVRDADLSGVTNATLTFDYKGNSLDGASEKGLVDVWDGSAWTNIFTLDGTQDDNTYHTESINLGGGLMISDFKVRFRIDASGSGDYFYIDDVDISGTASTTVTIDDNFNSGGTTGGNGWAGAWALAGNADIATSGGPQGSHHLRLRGGNPDGSATRSADLSVFSSATLTFDYKGNSLDGASEQGIVEVWDGSSWINVFTLDGTQDDNTYYTESITLNSAWLTSSFQVRFRLDASGSGDYFYIDNVSIEAAV